MDMVDIVTLVFEEEYSLENDTLISTDCMLVVYTESVSIC